MLIRHQTGSEHALPLEEAERVRNDATAAVGHLQTVEAVRPAKPPIAEWEGLVDYLIDVFHRVAEERLFPKYAFERRFDVLLAPFLPEVLARTIGGTFHFVASEFPLKHLDDSRSDAADALLFQEGEDRDGDRWWLFELKTDGGSFRENQQQSYLQALTRGPFRSLVDDVLLSS